VHGTRSPLWCQTPNLEKIISDSLFLDDTTFKTVIASTPLISIDLVVKNTKGEYLLGYRNNRPAQGFWFVPGGRIL
jgi:colanic acid biosynthesis protein WcaH